MAWVFEDLFNSDTKTTGDLNGQDGWSGGTQYDVTAALAFEGDQSVVRTNGADGSVIDNTYVDTTAGSLFFCVRRTSNTNSEQYVTLRDGGTAIMRVRFGADSNIAIQNDAGYTTIQAYSANVWYTCNIEYDDAGQPNQYRIRVRPQGSAWGSFSDWTNTAAAYTGLDSIRFEYGCSTCTDGESLYWDTITPTDPTPATAVGGLAARGLNLLGVGY